MKLTLKTKNQTFDLYRVPQVPQIGTTIAIENDKHKIVDIEYVFNDKNGLSLDDIILISN